MSDRPLFPDWTGKVVKMCFQPSLDWFFSRTVYLLWLVRTEWIYFSGSGNLLCAFLAPHLLCILQLHHYFSSLHLWRNIFTALHEVMQFSQCPCSRCQSLKQFSELCKYWSTFSLKWRQGEQAYVQWNCPRADAVRRILFWTKWPSQPGPLPLFFWGGVLYF